MMEPTDGFNRQPAGYKLTRSELPNILEVKEVFKRMRFFDLYIFSDFVMI